jgi:hypothetical protein
VKEIREPGDVTEAHIEEAAEMRDGIYGGVPLDWHEVIYKLETLDEDWGDSMESPAIKHLQREVRKLLKERG